ncbi:MAG: hypothetical protein UT82_C0023G0003 [Parcubacteria group bacterium GW2011_GWB1_40_14]|nr:MAG: hypothetical protein UT82_C0023G0003 [Parcubacteria group bacterium GW2011_GWB1_40_14]
MQTVNLPASVVPFAMQFASVPASNAVMEMSAGTISSVYCTDCGPNSSPDDGASTSNDD